jgi:DNA-binding NtrC family response regulator
LAELLAQQERLIIIRTLALCNYSRKEAAATLGIRRNYLWTRMRKLGIEVPRTSHGRPKKPPT